MAITITPLLTSVNTCETTTSWSGGPGLDSDVARHGTYCLGDKVSKTTADFIYDSGSGKNLTGHHFYIWMMVSTIGLMGTKAQGGMRVILKSGSSVYKTWYVDGKDTYRGGWQCYVIDPSSTADESSGTFDITSVQYFGVEFYVPSSTTGNNDNCFWDQSWYGTGLKVTSATSDSVDFEDLYTVDNTNAYGIINKINGVYFLQGEIILGDTTSGDINFESESQVVAFMDKPTNDSLYKIVVNGQSSTTTNVNLIGNFFTSNGDTYLMDLDNANIDTIDISGSTFQYANFVNLDSSVELLSTTFDNCKTIEPSGATLENCVIKNSSSTTAFSWDAAATISGCAFTGNTYSVEIDTAGTYEFNSLDFSGNVYDILNSSNGAVIINVVNGGSVGTYYNSNGGTTTINNGVQFKLTGLKVNTEVRVYDQSDMSELAGVEDSSTTFIYSYNYVSDKTCTIMIHSIGYENIRLTDLVLGDENITIPIQQQIDRWFNNP